MTLLSVNIMGGLGNQLFQIFTLLATAKKQNTEYVIEERDESPSITRRSTYWNKLFTNLNLSKNVPNNFQIFSEANHMKYQDIPTLSQNTKLDGYFQSRKYLQNIEDEILSYFSVSNDIKIKVYSIYTSLKIKALDRNLVFIHIRRGDYLNLSHVHYNLPLEYYKNASKLFDSDKTLFVIFSDDLEWCKNNLHFLKEKEFVDLEDYNTLILMSMMDGAIIANSSFSWWGAYLLELKKRNEKNETPLIVQPSRWFTQGNVFPNDRLNDSWVTI